MNISERQQKILITVINEYINSAVPISSKLLEKKHDFGICPASIRIEMQKLTDKGYLLQPHTSAGRIPTDKGYRFFVNSLMEEGVDNFENQELLKDFSRITKEIKDHFRLAQSITKKLTELTSDFVIASFLNEDIVLKEGWGSISEAPEFKNSDYLTSFINIIENWEENIESIKISPEINVYIGREHPFPGAKNFSTVNSNILGRKKGFLTILGPKRMAYEKNIKLINHFTRLLEEII